MAFLGVETSATGRRWVGPDPAVTRMASAMEQQTTLPPAVCAVLARRGVPAHEAKGFLEPQLRDLLPDPHKLRDMQAAAERFLQAVKQRQRIAIFADYDVDGGTSAALLLDWLRQMGRQATLYVPDRIDEGYGPNVPAMSALARDHDLIVCVDCGTLSHEPIGAAQGADVIVLDHHLGGETLPDCVAVVNPNRQDEDGALGLGGGDDEEGAARPRPEPDSAATGIGTSLAPASTGGRLRPAPLPALPCFRLSFPSYLLS